jgi:hypothetical protein
MKVIAITGGGVCTGRRLHFAQRHYAVSITRAGQRAGNPWR